MIYDKNDGDDDDDEDNLVNHRDEDEGAENDEGDEEEEEDADFDGTHEDDDDSSHINQHDDNNENGTHGASLDEEDINNKGTIYYSLTSFIEEDDVQALLTELNDTAIQSLLRSDDPTNTQSNNNEHALECLKRGEQLLEAVTAEGKDVDRNLIVVILYNLGCTYQR
jgi:hypothetical protein